MKRTGILKKSVALDCEFDEIKIHNWRRSQCEEYLTKYAYNSTQEFNSLVDILKSENHPLLERPYLFTKVVNYSFEDEKTPSEFVARGGNSLTGINDVIEAFVRREVIKWKDTDKETGRPYLTFNQHIRLLSEIAYEMWSNQKDIISIESMQFILTILFEDWKIESRIQPLIIRMIESYALLVPVENKDWYRKFDHEEFKHFFVARSFEQILHDAVADNNFSKASNFLYLAQLPDSVAQYLSKRINKESVLPIVKGLISVKRRNGSQPICNLILEHCFHIF